ncbi:MAG TPA: hypothetical protein VG897_01000 [Terriglobales bacterium]|nr:hypothetical protein [Terriglobales bacterium]
MSGRGGMTVIAISIFYTTLFPSPVRAQVDPTIPLRVTPPASVLDVFRQAEQIKLMQARRQEIEAETERIRQQMQLKQTEAKMKELEEEKKRNDDADREATRKAELAASTPTGPTSTGVLGNGRLWQISADSQRYAFLVGFMEALLVERADAGPRYFSKILTMQELTKAISLFYSQPENLAIPIPMALEIVRMKANGESPTDVEEQTAIARRVALEFASPTQR